MNEAVKFLIGDITLVLLRDKTVYTSNKRGVSALVEFVDNKTDLTGFCAADKVVGKGAAFLYVVLGVKSVYAGVISACAKEVLERHGIEVSYDLLVERISNRDKTGFCPIEEAVFQIYEPSQALIAIKEKLKKLRG